MGDLPITKMRCSSKVGQRCLTFCRAIYQIVLQICKVNLNHAQNDYIFLDQFLVRWHRLCYDARRSYRNPLLCREKVPAKLFSNPMFAVDMPSLRPGLRLDKHPVFCCLVVGAMFGFGDLRMSH